MTSQAVMKRYLTSVAKNNEEYKENKTIQYIASLIANYKKLEAKDKEELDAKIEIAYGKLQAKGVSASKSTSKATTTRRTKSSSDGGLKGILDDLKKKLGAEKFRDATRGTDIQKDIKIPALKKGKRIVRKKGYTSNFYGRFKNKVGSTYYENRANRYDANQPSQTRKYKLAKGGLTPQENLTKELLKLQRELNSPRLQKYTLGDTSPQEMARQNEREVKAKRFYEILEILNSKDKMAQGGEIEVGSIVNLPEIKMKDGRVQYERVVGGEVIGIEDGIYDVLNPKTNRLHRVTKQQIEQIDQAKAKHTRSRASLRSNEDTYPKGTEFAKGGEVGEINIAKQYGKMLNDLSKEKQFNKKIELNSKLKNFEKQYEISIDHNNIIYIKGNKVAYIDKINAKTGQQKNNWEIKKFAQGGKVSNIDDEIATQELKEEVKSKMKKGDAVIHFAFTDYGGDFIDKVAIEYFEENYPKNIVVENTAYFGKNAFVFGKPAEEWIEASEDYILGFEDFESFYYEKTNEAEQEGFEDYLGELEREEYEFDGGEVLSWLMENKGGYYNVTTQGLDFSSSDITDELLEEGLIRKEEYAKGGKLSSKAKYIPKRDIAEIEVEKNGKSKSIDGANLLDGVYVRKGTKFAKGGEVKTPIKIKKQLESIRKSIQNENVSYAELAELQSLSKYIDPNDIELREWAGIPEFEDGEEFAKGGKTKKIDYLRDAKELSEDERFELKVLQALGGFNNGLNINGLYESIGFSNYRFNQYATESQTKKVQKALSSLIKKEYVDESGLGYNITQKGANYKREFNFRSYAKGGTTKRIKRKGC